MVDEEADEEADGIAAIVAVAKTDEEGIDAGYIVCVACRRVFCSFVCSCYNLMLLLLRP